jgi:hypothetical protein
LTTATLPVAVTHARSVRIADRSWPVILPSRRDSRLHVALTLLTVQVLGQTVIDWDLSITQILLALGTCAVLEITIVAWRQGVLAWPASALLTGNGVALILRVPGTEHGDWWSTQGWPIFVGTAALSVVSKYLIRVGDRPLFNPSNLGLVLCFVVLGSQRVDPQDFWWGPWSPGLALTYAVIIVGGVVVTRRLHLLGVVVSFWVTLALALGVVALSGHAITARWHVGLLTDGAWWWIVVSSPETLIFLFFMITDPRTAPLGRVARVAYGVGVGVLAAVFAAPQQTEFATKVAILGALVAMCAVRPLLERALPAPDSNEDRWSEVWAALRGQRRLAIGGAALTTVLLVVALILAGGRSRALSPDYALHGERPVVAVGPIPEVAVDDAVADVVLGFDLAEIDVLARDMVEDLEIEAEALRTGDEGVAAQAAVGARLDDLLARMDTSGAVTVPHYRFDSLSLILHRELAEGQAAPRLGIEAHGSVRLDRSVDGRVTQGATEAHEAVYLLTEVDGHWLIDDERAVPDS